MIIIIIKRKLFCILQQAPLISGMKQLLYNQLTERKSGGKSFTVLIDPDKVDANKIDRLVSISMEANVDYLFVGGR